MENILTAAHTGTFPTATDPAANRSAANNSTKETDVTDRDDFEALLAQYMPTKAPSIFTSVKGTVLSTSKGGLFVDLGQKTESFCSTDEAGDLKPGDEATFMVLTEADEDGAVELSYVRNKNWQSAVDHLTSGETGKATVTEVARNRSGYEAGLKVNFGGIYGFVPRRELAVSGKLDALVGTEIPVKVLKAESSVERGRLNLDLVLSNQQAVPEVQDVLLRTLTVGGSVQGVVARIIFERLPEGASRDSNRPRKELGALIDLGNYVTGFVHRSECSFSRNVKPSDVLTVGETVEADIVNVDLDKREVKLSVKKRTIDRGALSKFTLHQTVSGTVSHVLLERVDRSRPNNGGPRKEIALLIDLGDGITGFLHRSEIGANRSLEPSGVLPVGTSVEVEVISIDEQTGQVKLSLDPMRKATIAELTAKKGQTVQGTISGIFPNVGFFVRLGDLVEGLLHNEELQRVGSEPETLAVGDSVEVVVLNVRQDEARRRTNIALSRRQQPKARS